MKDDKRLRNIVSQGGRGIESLHIKFMQNSFFSRAWPNVPLPHSFGRQRSLLASLAWTYAVLLIAISRVWTAVAPDPADAELFAYIGREWVRGTTLYRQIWDDKPPGIFAVNALAALTHHQFLTLAFVEFIAFLTTIILVSAILRQLDCSRLVVKISAVVAASILTIPYYSQGGNLTEIYVIPFAAGCIYCFLRAERAASGVSLWLVAAGINAGISAAFKPVGAASLLAISGFILTGHNDSVRSRPRILALTWGGFFAVWSLMVAFFSLYGAASTMLDASLFFPLHLAATASTHTSIARSIVLTADRVYMGATLLGCALVWLTLWMSARFYGANVNLLTVRQHTNSLLLFLWMSGDLCGAWATRRFYPHYFLPVMLSLVVVSCVGIDALIKTTSQTGYSRILVCALLTPIIVTGVKAQAGAYLQVRNGDSGEWRQAGFFIRDHKNPSDTVFVWGYWPGIYRIADSHTPTRWATAEYIATYPGAYLSVGRELISELRSSPPTFLVYPCSGKIPANPVRNEFIDFVTNEYLFVYSAGALCVARHSYSNGSDNHHLR